MHPPDPLSATIYEPTYPTLENEQAIAYLQSKGFRVNRKPITDIHNFMEAFELLRIWGEKLPTKPGKEEQHLLPITIINNEAAIWTRRTFFQLVNKYSPSMPENTALMYIVRSMIKKNAEVITCLSQNQVYTTIREYKDTQYKDMFTIIEIASMVIQSGLETGELTEDKFPIVVMRGGASLSNDLNSVRSLILRSREHNLGLDFSSFESEHQVPQDFAVHLPPQNMRGKTTNEIGKDSVTIYCGLYNDDLALDLGRYFEDNGLEVVEKWTMMTLHSRQLYMELNKAGIDVPEYSSTDPGEERYFPIVVFRDEVIVACDHAKAKDLLSRIKSQLLRERLREAARKRGLFP